jgi:hypothetical protein
MDFSSEKASLFVEPARRGDISAVVSFYDAVLYGKVLHCNVHCPFEKGNGANSPPSEGGVEGGRFLSA